MQRACLKMLRYFPFQQLSVLQRRAGEGVGDQARHHQEKQERTIIIKLPVRPIWSLTNDRIFSGRLTDQCNSMIKMVSVHICLNA